MDKEKKPSAVEQERIDLAQKLVDWVNEDPTERACVCVLASGGTFTELVMGGHRLCIEATASAIGSEESEMKQIVVESVMLSAMAKMSEE